MFGLEKKEKEKAVDEVFDLEIQLKDPGKRRMLRKAAEEKVQRLKAILREGGVQEAFEDHGLLLHGYAAFLRLTDRAEQQRKKA